MSDTRKSILHVDDDPYLHKYVDAVLGKFAYVTSVGTNKELKALLTGSAFDLFILDLVLKDGSGSIIAKELKARYPDTPVVILSAHDVTGAIEVADASFIKGKMTENEFVSEIKRLLG